MDEEIVNNEQQVQDTTVTEQPKQQEPQASEAERNFRDVRNQLAAAENRARELEERLRQNELAFAQRDQSNIDDEIDDDLYIEGKRYKKHMSNLKKELEETKKSVARVMEQNAIDQALMKLKSKFNDFDSVVTKENVQKLVEADPDLARTIEANNNVYDRAYVAYNLIKASQRDKNDKYDADARIEQNQKRVRSSSSASISSSTSPLVYAAEGDRVILSAEDKKRLIAQRNKILQRD